MIFPRICPASDLRCRGSQPGHGDRGAGLGASSIRITPGSPYSWMRAARISVVTNRHSFRREQQ